MKLIRFSLLSILIAGMCTACDSNRGKASVGNSQDTSKVIGGTPVSSHADSIQPKLKDSVKGGNVSPSGRITSDSVKKTK